MKNLPVTKENVKIGDRVVRGKDWGWWEQDKGSVYGVIKSKHYENDNYWIGITWVDYKGVEVKRDVYRIGPDIFDLYFYE